jgi:hypothetical protein
MSFASCADLLITGLSSKLSGGQLDRCGKIRKEVLTPLEPGEIEVWPEDPLDLLARVVALHAMRLLIRSYEDPAGFEEDKKLAPAEWSFCSAKDLDEDEPTKLKNFGR